MAKIREQSRGDRKLDLRNYNAIARAAGSVGRTNASAGVAGSMGDSLQLYFRRQKDFDPVPDSDPVTTTDPDAIRRKTLEIIDTSTQSWNEWSLHDVLKLQTTGHRKYPYFDTLGSTQPGATTSTKESRGRLRWDFPLLMLGSSTNKASAYARNSGTFPSLASSATYLGTSTYIQHRLEVEGTNTITESAKILSSNFTVRVGDESDFSGVNVSGGGVTGVPTAELVSSRAGVGFQVAYAGEFIGPSGGPTIYLGTSAKWAAYSRAGSIGLETSSDEFHAFGSDGLTFTVAIGSTDTFTMTAKGGIITEFAKNGSAF